MLLVMYMWGGVGLRGFNFVMLIGIVIGTYSSIAIASPLLLIGQGKAEAKR
jgi:SecD/SecF fusion protein